MTWTFRKKTFDSSLKVGYIFDVTKTAVLEKDRLTRLYTG